MKFDFIVMQLNGQITDRHRYQVEALRNRSITRALIDEASSLLRSELSPDPARCGTFRRTIAPSGGYILHWRQALPTSALVTMLIDGQPSILSLLLFGGEPVSDGIAVKVTCEMIRSTEGLNTPNLARAFDTIRQRPAVVIFPFLHEITQQQRVLTIRTVCLASAFFERAAEFIAKADALWKHVAGGKPHQSSEHLWN